MDAPKVTQAGVDAAIKSVDYVVLPDGRTTIAMLTLDNGFTVRGESSCVCKENFREDLGQQYALENAKNQVWRLLGFRLADRLYDRVESTARIAHEINRAYCEALGDTSQLPWEDAPEWQRVSARAGVILHQSGDHGPEASHEAWMAQKVAAGWTYGQEKDPEAKTHPCLVPFDQLPREQQAKDYLFRAVVHALGR